MEQGSGPPASRRPQARLDHLHDMGGVAVAGNVAFVTTRTGERMEWRKMPGSVWFERVDAAAPVAPEGSVMHADPRENPSALVLEEQRAPKTKGGAGTVAAMLEGLDDDQRAVAIDWVPQPGGVTRALAAAGSGKTHTTIALVGRLLQEGRLAPSDVVITTFTAKAADELKKRFKATLAKGLVPEKVGTFHSLAYRALKLLDPARWNIKRCVDLPKSADVPRAAAIWRMVLDGRPQGELFELLGRPGLGVLEDEGDVKAYASGLDVLRSRPCNRGELLRAVQEHPLKEFGAAVSLYFKAKEKLSAFDWADATEAWHAALVSGDLGASAALVCVDEAQDCTAIQLEVATLLAKKGTLLLIGDVRQAIYEWRGASPDILKKADELLGATTLQLRRNYRSGRRIVELGNAICEGADWAVGDPAVAVRADPGEIELRPDNADGPAEAEDIAEDIEESGQPGGSAVLCRTHAVAALVEAALMGKGIACAVAGGSSFFDSKVAKDSLAFYALSLQGVGGPDELRRVLRIPAPRYLGSKFIERVRAEGGDVVQATRRVAGDSSLNEGQTKAARELAELIVELRRIGWAKVPARVAILIAAAAAAKAEDNDDGATDVGALAATMAMVAQRFESPREIKKFADKCTGNVKGLDDGETDEGRVVISTIHKAKGLEWSTVYVAGLTEGVFPHAKSDTPEREAEERRLFYVAVTRAKNRLVLSRAAKNPYGQEAGPGAFAQLAEDFMLGAHGAGAGRESA